MYELAIDSQPTWTVVPLDDPKTIVIAAHYRGRQLELLTSIGTLIFLDGKRIRQVQTRELDAQMIPDAGPDVAITPGRDGRLHFYNDVTEGSIALPVAMSDLHLAGRPGKTRFVAASSGVVLVYDLAELLPTSIPKGGLFQAVFADDDTVLLWPDDGEHWRWHDLVTNTETVLDHPLQTTDVLGLDGTSGRILLREQTSQTSSDLVILTKGAKQPRHVTDGDHLRGRLVDGGVIFASGDDARVRVSLHDEPPRELAKVDGGVKGLQPLDTGRFAALGNRGELVRGSLTGGSIERVHVDLEPDGFLGTDRAGHVLVINGTHLLEWDAGVHEVAQLARPIQGTYATDGGVMAFLDDNSAVYVELGSTGLAQATVHRLLAPSALAPTVGGDGSWIATAGNGGQLTVVEMPAMARWTLPLHDGGNTLLLEASPNKRRLMRGDGTRIEITTLPKPGADLAAWIDERTNASEGLDGVVTWPWQRGP